MGTGASVATLDGDAVAAHIESIGGNYAGVADTVRSNGVDGTMLLSNDPDELLDACEVTNKLQRMKLKSEIGKLHNLREDGGAVAAPAPAPAAPAPAAPPR